MYKNPPTSQSHSKPKPHNESPTFLPSSSFNKNRIKHPAVSSAAMPRSQRFLGSAPANTSFTVAAPPPEAVALESDFVVILAALLCAVICVVGLLAVARCAWLRRGSGGAAPGSVQSSSAANRGLKKKVLNSLPKYTYPLGGTAEPPPKLAVECAICLVEFSEGDEIRVLPQCGHAFHVGCIDTWLGAHSSCPSCRQILVVARCQKCGNFPAPVSASGPPAVDNAAISSSNATTTLTISNTYLP